MNCAVCVPVAPGGIVAVPPLVSSRSLSTLSSRMWAVWTLNPRERSAPATAPLLMASGSPSNSLALGTWIGLSENDTTRALHASSGGEEGLGAEEAGFFGGAAASSDLLSGRPGAGEGEGAFAAAAAAAAGKGLGAGASPRPDVPISEQGPNSTTLKREKSSTLKVSSYGVFSPSK